LGHRNVADTMMLGKLESRAYEAALRTPIPRSIRGTHPGCVSLAQNVATPMKSQGNLSKPTARKAETFSENKMSQKAKAASRKATGMHNWADRAIPTLKGG
jgi:hypothetical protein